MHACTFLCMLAQVSVKDEVPIKCIPILPLELTSLAAKREFKIASSVPCMCKQNNSISER